MNLQYNGSTRRIFGILVEVVEVGAHKTKKVGSQEGHLNNRH